MERSVVFLHMNHEKSKMEIKKMILYIITPKRKKNLGINLVKEIKDLYTEFKVSLGLTGWLKQTLSKRNKK